MKPATVTANEQVADRFHLITVEGDALEGVTWRPGQKVQIAMGSAFVTRTYTPIEWNPSAGRMCILGYAHGEGPGSTWVRTVAPGAGCDIFGPRASLDIGSLPGPLVILGDETSIGLAYAATHQDRARLVTSCFEVEGGDTAQRVIASLGLQGVSLVARRADNAHLPALDASLSDGVAAGASFVLTGKAATIQRLRQSLRQQSVPATRLVTKAYWTPGKAGLD
ncbi:siderophore-interacting protein [Sphingomonas gei]|nr:siderophore-interacting protein [Sphingomonas gei]